MNTYDFDIDGIKTPLEGEDPLDALQREVDRHLDQVDKLRGVIGLVDEDGVEQRYRVLATCAVEIDHLPRCPVLLIDTASSATLAACLNFGPHATHVFPITRAVQGAQRAQVYDPRVR